MGPGAYSADRSKVEKALTERYRMQADPVRAAEEAKLAARGLAPGSQNWGRVQDAQNRQDLEAGYKAIEAGGAEQSRLLGEERAGWQQGQHYTNFLNNLRGAQFGERQALRNQPINEISALMGGSQVTVPQFQQFSRQGVDAAPIGQYIQDNYQHKVNAANATNQGLFGLGGAGIKLMGGMPFFCSDRRLKIRHQAARACSSPGCRCTSSASCRRSCFSRSGGQQVGVMSDEVRKLHPDAVIVDRRRLRRGRLRHTPEETLKWPYHPAQFRRTPCHAAAACLQHCHPAAAWDLRPARSRRARRWDRRPARQPIPVMPGSAIAITDPAQIVPPGMDSTATSAATRSASGWTARPWRATPRSSAGRASSGWPASGRTSGCWPA